MDNVHKKLLNYGKLARQAAPALAIATTRQKNDALNAIAQAIKENFAIILEANAIDTEAARGKGLSAALQERLKLDPSRLEAIVASVEQIATLKDPVGEVMTQWVRPNGLKIARIRKPIGVIGVIYESRPNVTIDAAALCLKSANPVILRGGSDAYHSCLALYKALQQGLNKAGLPLACVQYVETQDREAVGYMLEGLAGQLDVLIPRGGKSLVARIEKEARVPIFSHLEGVCHVYLDASADLKMAEKIAINSKMRRPAICGAMETLLIDSKRAEEIAQFVLPSLQRAGCQLKLCPRLYPLFKDVSLAHEEDWYKEYLAPILAVKVVKGVEGAVAHIRQYGSQHTEAIVAEDRKLVEQFFKNLDSAILLHNASTQFADGGEFGFGAEIGIATGKLHARGPIGVEQLTCFNYQIEGTGQVRA